MLCSYFVVVFFVKQKTAYELRISDWSSDVCSSDLLCSGPHRVLLTAPINERSRRWGTRSAIESAHPHRSVTFVRGQAEIIDVKLKNINGNLPSRLRRIGMKQCARRMCDRGYLLNRLNHTGLIVYHHTGDQKRNRPKKTQVRKKCVST